jgi:hypothetical protein
MSIKKTNRNNRLRGKSYEKRVAASVGGVRNMDKSRPHTDVENATHVYEVKSTQSTTPVWLKKALGQLEQAATESDKLQGGVVKVYTKGSKARAFLIQEIELLQ